MGKLSFAIVQQKLASLRDVEEALARQILYGSDLATNLLDQAPTVDEPALTLLLAESHGLPHGPTREIPAATAETLNLVPSDVALRHGLYPLEKSGGTLVVVVSGPLRADVERDLTQALGVTIEQRVAPLVRIRQALSRDYGLPMDRRTARIIAKLEGRPDPSPSLEPPPFSLVPEIGALPRPPSMPPIETSLGDRAPLYAELRPPSDPAPRPSPPGEDKAPASIRPMSLVAIISPRGSPSPPASPRLPPLPAPTVTHVPSTTPTPRPSRAIPPETTSIHDQVTREAPPVAPIPPPREPEPIASEPPPARREPPAAIASEPPPARHEPPALTVPDLAAWTARSQKTQKAKARHRGPYTATAAEQDMLAAEERDDVLAAFFDFARQYFEYSALFVVHGDLAEGRVAYGPGADPAAVAGIGVPLDLPSSLTTVRREGRFAIGPLAREGIDAGLAEDLKRTSGKAVLLLPIVVRKRCVLILYGDHGAEDVDLSELGDVIAFAPLVVKALEGLIRKKKLAVRSAVTEMEQPAPLARSLRPKTHHPTPSREERAEALAQALSGTTRPGGEGALKSRAPQKPPRATPAPVAQRSPVSLPTKPHSFIFDSSAAPAPAPAPARAPASASLAANAPPKPAPAAPAAAPPAAPPAAAPKAAPTLPSLDVVGFGAAPSLRAKSPPKPSLSPKPSTGEGKNDPTPAFPLSRRIAPAPAPAEPSEEDWDVPLTKRDSPRATSAAAPGDGPEISIAGMAEVDLPVESDPRGHVIVATQIPQKRHSSAELRLPKVIVNIDRDIETLVVQYLNGDAGVLDRLASMGAPAASVLAGRLPGPIEEPDRLGPSASAQRGPVLRALARIGAPAVPFIAVRTSDTDPSVRTWATRLLGEIPTSDGALAVARRVTDEHADVRAAAMDAGRAMQSNPSARAALTGRLGAMAADEGLPLPHRLAAIEACQQIRDGSAVPLLIPFVSRNDDLGRAAYRALVTLARRDLPPTPEAWESWWSVNHTAHRIEWLIDALMDEAAEVRRAAGDELKALTKEYFGYYDDLPKKERERAQNRYRDWWETTGKARFS